MKLFNYVVFMTAGSMIGAVIVDKYGPQGNEWFVTAFNILVRFVFIYTATCLGNMYNDSKSKGGAQ